MPRKGLKIKYWILAGVSAASLMMAIVGSAMESNMGLKLNLLYGGSIAVLICTLIWIWLGVKAIHRRSHR